MKEKIKDKLKERIDYILSKDARDITDEEYNLLIDKLDNLECQNSNSNNLWVLMILMFLFIIPSKDIRGDEKDV